MTDAQDDDSLQILDDIHVNGLHEFPGFREFIEALMAGNNLHSPVTMLKGLPEAVEVWRKALQADIDSETA